MPIKVIVALDKLKNPNCGLGRVAIDFSQALIQLNDPEIDLSFLVYNKQIPSYLKDHSLIRMNAVNRYVPVDLREFRLFHSIHQLPSYQAKGATKRILTIHDLNFLHTKSTSKAKKYLHKVQTNVYQADALVFVSNYTREMCLSHLIIPSHVRTSVIYNGIELANAEPVKPACLDNDGFLFSIGQFLPKKNFHVLIPFLQRLPEEIKLVIAGEHNTSYGNLIRRSVAESGLQKRIILPGPVSEEEKLYLYQHCKAFVFPSLAEGFGLPVIEAMRAGKPVFCSDQTSLKEIGGQHAFFWDSFDADKMAELFATGMADFSEQRKKEAVEYSLSFSWPAHARQYVSLYKSLFS